ncbi:MAG: M48 family metalloprotease [Acidobacteria bacterium]|nr:M48 family metalloprotease [Acidobacteriota bacterium]
MHRKTFAALSLCAALLYGAAPARAQDCAPPAIVANAKSDNMFTPEQEMIFGELAVQNMAGEVRFIRDEKLTAYINQIGERIIKHLPPTGLKFRFYLVDIPDANAFNLPGGHVAVSRKLVAFVHNEDELAGVIAHELGHAVVRHAALDMSEALRKVLNVTSLGDRKDVTEKYNLLIERARTRKYSRTRGHENGQQLEADQIGVYALVAAGYDPNGLASFFGRLTESKARGGWFSELFGNASPEQKRLYEMAKAAEKMPAPCRERAAARPTEEFLKWQAEVVSYREAGRKEELPGLLWRRDLAPKLRSDVSHLAFSRDGKLLLAQDDYSVNVIAREPQPHVLFQIPVEDADDATFTPDGRFVVFTTERLRYERWSVADAAPVEVREIVMRGDCWQHGLSPDGNYLACVDTSANASLLDVKSGKKVWEKKEFYKLDLFEYLMWLGTAAQRAAGGGDGGDDYGAGFFRIGFSPDARYVMFSRSESFRFNISWDGMGVAGSKDTAAAVDLTTLKQVDVGGDVKRISARPYVFLDAETVLGMPSGKAADSGTFAFPSGKRLRKFEFNALAVQRTENPDLVIIKPISNAKLGLFDLKHEVLLGGFDKEDAAAYGNLVAYEALNGNILLREASYNEEGKRLDLKDVGAAEIPVSLIRGLAASDVSDDFGWLMLSSKTRGGLWSLKTGERKVYVRGFKGAVTANDGGAVGDFPKLGEVPHSLVLMNGVNGNVGAVRELPEKGARQYGRFVLVRTSLKGEQPKENSIGALVGAAHGESQEDFGLRRGVRFDLKDIIRDKVIWTRDFPQEAPEFSFDAYSGRLIFYWRLGSEVGKAKLKESADLAAKADALGNKADDYLVEVVDAFSQQTVGTMLLETGKGSFDVGRGLSEGDRLVLHDSEGRVLIYSLKTGELRQRFFGDTAAVNPKRSQVVVENFPGEVSVYDLDTGDLKANLRINGSAAFVRFNLAGDRLFILSDAQTAYAFDLDKLAAASAPPAQAAN